MLQDRIGYRFRNPALFRKAMTHSSYANEQRMRHLQNNERLEFLGDSVLGFVTADYLYNHFPELPEGQLTKLRAAVVCEHALYEIAQAADGRAEIYLDGGIEPARAFVLSFIPRKAEEARKGGAFTDYKTQLQEIVQKNRQETLEYRLAGESGPDHAKVFTMELLLNSNVFAQGTGRSKKEAEQMAAKQALELMGVRKA